ncbi:TetR/AcrR family transcriptional regulator [Cryptosporangium sp. NPDC051539]|uniref:TetR/AcrR family transcriptional regulator n=1 Tax=Cryptosporangium sp. NPDC051539 TaxID=3363962 RepID=UPI0037A9BE6F
MSHGGDVVPGRPLRRDAERNRQRILAAAREVFAARGVDVTLDDIAHHAGLGVGTLYRRFPSREMLVEALFSERLDEMVRWAAEALQAEAPSDGVWRFAERSAEAMAADRGLRDVIFSRAYGHERVEAARARLEPLLEALVVRARAAGALRPGVRGGDLAMIQFMLGSVLEYSEFVDPQLWRRYLVMMLDGLRATPDAAPLPGSAPGPDVLAAVADQWKPPRRPGH